MMMMMMVNQPTDLSKLFTAATHRNQAPHLKKKKILKKTEAFFRQCLLDALACEIKTLLK